MVYGDEGALASLDVATREGKLTNEIYVRSAERTRWEVVSHGVERISGEGISLSGGGKRASGPLAVRSVVWAQLRVRDKPNAQHVFVMNTHFTGGRFEDQYYLQELAQERHAQVTRAMQPFKARARPGGQDVGVLIGDFNATTRYAKGGPMQKYFEGAIASSEGVIADAAKLGLSAEETEARFATYMVSPFAAIAEEGWRMAYDPVMVGATSAFGQTIDHMATSQVCDARVEKLYTTNQRFGGGPPDTSIPLTDHNAVKVTFTTQ